MVDNYDSNVRRCTSYADTGHKRVKRNKGEEWVDDVPMSRGTPHAVVRLKRVQRNNFAFPCINISVIQLSHDFSDLIILCLHLGASEIKVVHY